MGLGHALHCALSALIMSDHDERYHGCQAPRRYPHPGCFGERGCKLLKIKSGRLKKRAKRGQRGCKCLEARDLRPGDRTGSSIDRVACGGYTPVATGSKRNWLGAEGIEALRGASDGGSKRDRMNADVPHSPYFAKEFGSC